MSDAKHKVGTSIFSRNGVAIEGAVPSVQLPGDGEALFVSLGAPDEVMRRHAALFVEALDAAHETGMTPRQLAERVKQLETGNAIIDPAYVRAVHERNELLATLDKIEQQLDYGQHTAALNIARAAIAKAEGKEP